VLSADRVPERFRDYPTRPLAARIARDGMLDAAIVGDAAVAFERRPETIAEPGTPRDEVLTQLRRLWHVLVLEGSPRW
jgi:hypothetical protein